ncbi:Anti-CBASS protein Acb1 [Balamuthia mandrillaris]
MNAKEGEGRGEGTFIGARLSATSLDALELYMRDNDIPNALSREHLHITIVNSDVSFPYTRDAGSFSSDSACFCLKSYCDEDKEEKGEQLPLFLYHGTFKLSMWKTSLGTSCLVLNLQSPELQARHQAARALGATHAWKQYSPHLTLSYDCGDSFAVARLSPPRFDLEVVHEFGEDRVEGWSGLLTRSSSRS